jgi:hypothetical protein
MFLTVSKLGYAFVYITIQNSTIIPIEFMDILCPRIKYIIYLLVALEAELNALKDSTSYLKASDRDCIDASLSVLFPVNK